MNKSISWFPLLLTLFVMSCIQDNSDGMSKQNPLEHDILGKWQVTLYGSDGIPNLLYYHFREDGTLVYPGFKTVLSDSGLPSVKYSNLNGSYKLENDFLYINEMFTSITSWTIPTTLKININEDTLSLHPVMVYSGTSNNLEGRWERTIDEYSISETIQNKLYITIYDSTHIYTTVNGESFPRKIEYNDSTFKINGYTYHYEIFNSKLHTYSDSIYGDQRPFTYLKKFVKVR